MRTGDYIYVRHHMAGGRAVVEGGVLRHITGIAVVLEPEEGRWRSRRIPWTAILDVSRSMRLVDEAAAAGAGSIR